VNQRDADARSGRRNSFVRLGSVALAAAVLAGLSIVVGAAGGANFDPPLDSVAEADAIRFTPDPETGAAAVESGLGIAMTPVPELDEFPPTAVITRGELKRGDTLAAAMRRENIPYPVVHQVSTELAGLFDFRRAQPGHSFQLTQDLDGRTLDFRYMISDIESLHLEFVAGQYRTSRDEIALVPRVARIAGIVTSSLYASLRDLGEGSQLANDFADVFAWDVDFSRAVKAGDEFSILYERLYLVDDDGAESYVGPGRILAARYGGTVGEHTAIYYETREGKGRYYRPDGTSVEREFLMAPLKYSRISSNYSAARRHPILKITRPHHGIDYAAKQGSPVWSVSDGKVIYRSRAGGFGNLVKVRHGNGYISYYAHLSRFAEGLKVGDSVRQKQVIGYVGQTGLATGPHVCFRVAKNGSYVNPARVESPAARPIPDEIRHAFVERRDLLLSELTAGTYAPTADAL
jgi:murein DD-endopeptidase MepM/ murein hydrolase activator NlpD